jgi:hypothetical protein
MSDWLQNQMMALESLEGKTVTRWVAIEMALREYGLDGLPSWEEQSIPYLQLSRLDVVLRDSVIAKIVCMQDDDSFGLYRNDDVPELSMPDNSDPTSIFRHTVLHKLPVGRIEAVKLVTQHNLISEITFRLDQNHVSLKAGEVYEGDKGSLRIVTPDESILVQLNGRRPD